MSDGALKNKGVEDCDIVTQQQIYYFALHWESHISELRFIVKVALFSVVSIIYRPSVFSFDYSVYHLILNVVIGLMINDDDCDFRLLIVEKIKNSAILECAR
jgi:uncharacterized membrane protein YwaF